jgi:hypothetical protein
VLGAAVLSNKSYTRYFLKIPWQFAFCYHTAPQGFPAKNHWHAPGPTGVSGRKNIRALKVYVFKLCFTV